MYLTDLQEIEIASSNAKTGWKYSLATIAFLILSYIWPYSGIGIGAYISSIAGFFLAKTSCKLIKKHSLEIPPPEGSMYFSAVVLLFIVIYSFINCVKILTQIM